MGRDQVAQRVLPGTSSVLFHFKRTLRCRIESGLDFICRHALSKAQVFKNARSFPWIFIVL